VPQQGAANWGPMSNTQTIYWALRVSGGLRKEVLSEANKVPE
jgi:hypothetical protein